MLFVRRRKDRRTWRKKKLLEGRTDLTTVTSRVGLGPRPHWLDGVRDCPHPLPSLPPPPRRSPLTIIFIRRQWIFNLEGSRVGGGGRRRLLEGGNYFKHFRQRREVIQGRRLIEATAIIRGNTVNMSSIIIVKCLYNVYIIFFVEY